MSDDPTTTDWYTDLERDAAFLGDFEAEDRRFGHEAGLPIGPVNIGPAMRATMDGCEHARGMSMAAFIDCLFERRPYSLMRGPAPQQTRVAA